MSRIFLMMENEQPYKCRHFSLKNVSIRMGVDKEIVDNVVKDYSGLSFLELINLYRINYTQELVCKGYDLNTACKLAGFRSKRMLFKAFDSIVI